MGGDALGLDSIEGSLVVVAVVTVLSASVCELATRLVTRTVVARPWWERAEGLQKEVLLNFGFSEGGCTSALVADAYAFVCVTSVWHLVTGLMTLPVVILGWSAAGQGGRTLFLLVGLCDVSYDVYDSIKRFLLTFLQPFCKCLGPPWPVAYFVIAVLLHHSLAIALVIPMNLHYPDLQEYHVLLSSQLLGAAICCITGQYKFSLDTTTLCGFRQYQAIVVVQFVTIWATRGVLWFWPLWTALAHFQAEGDTPFFVGGIVAGILMSLFNLLLIFDCTQAAVKWLPKPAPKVDEASE